ncbi:serine protease inhibitor swm-1-like [Centruroides vittatus]|uniref:serine protease inhibitor swm-1-like n=1 Tax=Centruroides vittatus TaxID=120091 RepID=UPI00350F62FA
MKMSNAWKIILLVCGINNVFGKEIYTSEENCEKNEIYVKAGCEPLCDNILKGPPFCSNNETRQGCFCKTGFVRNSSDHQLQKERNQCITIEECGTRVCTHPNTELNFEGRINFCTKDGIVGSVKYPLGFLSICNCKRGFVWKDYICIPEAECRKSL